MTITSAAGIALALLIARHRPPEPLPVDYAAAAVATSHTLPTPSLDERTACRPPGERLGCASDARRYSSPMTDTSPAWVPAGTAFDADDFVYFHDKGRRPVEDVLGEIDLILTGPHASAAFPEEMAPFVDDRLTCRLQHDFTDISTSPVGRRWAEIDPHVLYVENPHPRAVRDANRARPDDLGAGLREAFERLRRAGETERPSLTGVDAIRPVTFGYLPVLREPRDDDDWNELIDAMTTAGSLGVDVYERVRDDLIERTVNAKLARLASLDPADVTVSEWRSASTLLVMSLHDTMNHTARSDGAICVERQPVDRLPNVVALVQPRRPGRRGASQHHGCAPRRRGRALARSDDHAGDRQRVPVGVRCVRA